MRSQGEWNKGVDCKSYSTSDERTKSKKERETLCKLFKSVPQHK